jgi:hypothetical protein
MPAGQVPGSSYFFFRPPAVFFLPRAADTFFAEPFYAAAFRAFTVGFLREAAFFALRAATFATRRVFLTTRRAVRLIARRAGAGTTRAAASPAAAAAEDVVEAAALATCDAVLTAEPITVPTISADFNSTPSVC